MNIRFDPEVAATVEQSPDRTLTACHTDALLTALCEIYCNDPERRTATIALPHASNEAHRTRTFISQARNENLIDIAQQHEDHLLLTTSRKTFWQIARPWLKAPASSDTLLRYTQTNGVTHPQRPTNAEGTIYERHFPQIDMTFSLRTADPDADSEVFSEWMNLDRVAYFWDQRGTRAEHAAYLAERREDPHMHPMIGYFDDKPFGYFEFYWAKEDRLGPFYDAGDFDRGLHLLIGDAQFQSAGKLKAWWERRTALHVHRRSAHGTPRWRTARRSCATYRLHASHGLLYAEGIRLSAQARRAHRDGTRKVLRRFSLLTGVEGKLYR